MRTGWTVRISDILSKGLISDEWPLLNMSNLVSRSQALCSDAHLGSEWSFRLILMLSPLPTHYSFHTNNSSCVLRNQITGCLHKLIHRKTRGIKLNCSSMINMN
jgi:hypothetical protein